MTHSIFVQRSSLTGVKDEWENSFALSSHKNVPKYTCIQNQVGTNLRFKKKGGKKKETDRFSPTGSLILSRANKNRIEVSRLGKGFYVLIFSFLIQLFHCKRWQRQGEKERWLPLCLSLFVYVMYDCTYICVRMDWLLTGTKVRFSQKIQIVICSLFKVSLVKLDYSRIFPHLDFPHFPLQGKIN